MAVYDGERFLARSVDSILAQTYADFEFLIVDDGSRDQTPALLADYARKDPRLRVLTNPQNLRRSGSLCAASIRSGANPSHRRGRGP